MKSEEWIVYDKKQGEIAFVHAEEWREATIKAMDEGVKPRRHLDVRPRTGDSKEYPCTPRKGFNEFMRN